MKLNPTIESNQIPPDGLLEELQRSEARFRTVFENSAIGVLILDVDALTFQLNDAARAILDDPDLDRKLKDVYEFIHMRYQETERELFEQLLKWERDFCEAERWYQRPGEETKWAKVTLTAIRDTDRQLCFIVAMIDDITERRKAQNSLRESEARFRATFESSAIGMGLLGLDGRILQVNEAVCKMSGYGEEELLQRYDSENVFPPDRELGMDLFAELLEGKRTSFGIEKRYARKNGEVFWARLTLSLVRTPNGDPSYLVGMIEDIDQQKRVFDELQKSEARFRAMFDNVTIDMALVGFDRRALAVNQTIAQISGYSIDELTHINISDLVYPEDREIGADQFVEMVSGHRKSMQLERRYVRKNGEIFWARICYSLVRDSNGEPRYLVGSMEDITDRKRAADKMAEQETEYFRTLEQRVEERTHELGATNLRLVAEIEQRKRVEAALAEKAADDAVTAERTLLARELHDAVTQTLFASSLIAEVLPDL